MTQLESRIEQAKIFIEKDIKRLSDLVVKMNHNKKFLIDSITKQNADCVGDIQQSKGSLQCMLEVLLGKCDEVGEVSGSIMKVEETTVFAAGPLTANVEETVQETPKKKTAPRKKAPVAPSSNIV